MIAMNSFKRQCGNVLLLVSQNGAKLKDNNKPRCNTLQSHWTLEVVLYCEINFWEFLQRVIVQVFFPENKDDGSYLPLRPS